MFGGTLVGMINDLLDLYCLILFAGALVSWVSQDRTKPIVRVLDMVTNPVLEPVRRLLPPWKTGGLDLSPAIVIIAIQVVVKRLVVLALL